MLFRPYLNGGAFDLVSADRMRALPSTRTSPVAPESENPFLIESINMPARTALFLR